MLGSRPALVVANICSITYSTDGSQEQDIVDAHSSPATRLPQIRAEPGVRASTVLAALGIVYGDLGTSPLYTSHS
jgi:hypothetical protein